MTKSEMDNQLLNAINTNSERVRQYHYEALRRNRMQVQDICRRRVANSAIEICILGSSCLLMVMVLAGAYRADIIGTEWAILIGTLFGMLGGGLIGDRIRRIKYYRRGF